MRKFIIFLIFALLQVGIFSACQSNDEKIFNGNDKNLEQNYMNDSTKNNNKEEKIDIIKETNKSKEILEKFNTKVLDDANPYQIKEYIDDNISEVTEADADIMIIAFEKIQKDNILKYSEMLFDSSIQKELLDNFTVYKLERDMINTLENNELKVLLGKIYDAGYAVVSTEGAFYPVIDYSSYNEYVDYTSNSMNLYIDIMSHETDFPFAYDAGIIISLDELSERIIKSEEFIKNYSNNYGYNEVKKLYGYYIKAYLLGLDNTPIYDFNTLMVKDEVLRSYENYIEVYPNSDLTPIIYKYLQFIKDNKYYYTNEYDTFILDKQSSWLQKEFSPWG